MRATIHYPRAVRAAAALASDGRSGCVFQVRREGDRARVSGTNGFVSVSALVGADFSRWADGRALTLGGRDARAVLAAVGRSLTKADAAEVNVCGGIAVFSAELEGAKAEASVRIPEDVRYAALTDRDWSFGADRTGTPPKAIDPHFMKLAAQALETLKLPVPTETGPDSCRIFRFRAKTEDVEAIAAISETPVPVK